MKFGRIGNEKSREADSSRSTNGGMMGKSTPSLCKSRIKFSCSDVEYRLVHAGDKRPVEIDARRRISENIAHT